MRYPQSARDEVRNLRRRGFTYGEINEQLRANIPKSSLSYICRDIVLSPAQKQRISDLQLKELAVLRQKALIKNKELLAARIKSYRDKHLSIEIFMESREAKLVALAMLYLGEGAKWQGRRGLMLGSSDPKIIKLYISLLHDCYDVKLSQLKCRIQHRADQDADKLLTFWSEATGIAKTNFYPSYIDQRTVGQKTRKLEYKGVCSVTGGSTQIQLELEQIAGIIFEAV
jgi:hypothetical protein